MNCPVTSQEPFESVDGGEVYAVAVLPGVPVQALLEHCSYRMAILKEFLRESSEGDDGVSQNTLFLIENEVSLAKAMVDACSSGLMKGGFA
jgi:hypothetical protein